MIKKIIAVLFVLLIGALYTGYLTRDKQLDIDKYWKGAPNVTWHPTGPIPNGGRVDPAWSDEAVKVIVDKEDKAHPSKIKTVSYTNAAEAQNRAKVMSDLGEHGLKLVMW